ncbi:hypothetical protein V8G54_007673 [Vigna mungo]|uniref:Uncharacterized protein n=1 Tax=Vigna mungo TaxID=3915 RepID=A0AAQ3P1L8_VIGMU
MRKEELSHRPLCQNRNPPPGSSLPLRMPHLLPMRIPLLLPLEAGSPPRLSPLLSTPLLATEHSFSDQNFRRARAAEEASSRWPATCYVCKLNAPIYTDLSTNLA